MRVELASDRVVANPAWQSTAGPQTTFAECAADWAFYGGAKGGGKTIALLLDGGRWHDVPGFNGVIFRRTTPEITDAGGLFDEAMRIYPLMGARERSGNYTDFRWPSGARISMSHLQHEADAIKHEGRQYGFIGFDELTHFTLRQVQRLDSRLRSTCGVRPYLRGTCNPDRDSWVFDFVEWYLLENGMPDPAKAGVLRWFTRDQENDELLWFDTREEAEAATGVMARSFTFIPSSVFDNAPLLASDPSYLGTLQNATRADRARWLDGNWHARDGAGLVFARNDFKLVKTPPADVLATVRAWDKAASGPTKKHPNPDWTRGVRVSLLEGGGLWIDDVVGCQAHPGEVFALMQKTAKADGIEVTQVIWQDTGQAGVVDVDTTRRALEGYVVEVVHSHSADTTAVTKSKHRSSRPKRAFAKAWAPLVQSGDVYVLRGAPWTGALLSECDGFPDAKFDDIVDAISAAYQELVGNGADWWALIKKGAARGR